ncbi:phosphoadenylyl-sulfate reductase [Haloferula rosea]|uniref:Phosphoadenosine 5'-phosphosulfate reductase n=1 Tax=Haloferula rosea TaxID=490093 RepID=A0A934REZ5_9BACT|nr:phosphoadenylyl-sulfate reductase [Haloferula rosea]MBK1827175.1 phosphoadenylyl-sulfate reductase [Haloferula rosea]
MTLSTEDATVVADELASLNAGERLRYLQREFAGRLVASTSFGIQSAVMLDLIAEHAPEIPVVFVDTGYLFPETYQYAEDLVQRLGTDLRVYQPAMTSARMEALHGRLWEGDKEAAERYGVITKIEPMARALKELNADIWLSGVRRSQSSTRADRRIAEQQKRTLKVYPILDWADAQVSAYMHDRGLPRHPLAEQGYVTMGDWHSTRPAADGLDPESTRFGGEKYECGLHLDSGNTDFQI